jgi:NADPH:quinone reductase-like Zn-dependent oxidoreductase
MKAAVLAGYDKNGRDLEIRELPIPEPAPGEALVRIHTAA